MGSYFIVLFTNKNLIKAPIQLKIEEKGKFCVEKVIYCIQLSSTNDYISIAKIIKKNRKIGMQGRVFRGRISVGLVWVIPSEHTHIQNLKPKYFSVQYR